MMSVMNFVLAHEALFSALGLLVLNEIVRLSPFIKGNSIAQAAAAYLNGVLSPKAQPAIQEASSQGK